MNRTKAIMIGIALGLAGACWGQCDPGWDAAPSSPLGQSISWGLIVHDDGAGAAPHLVCGDPLGVLNVARWNGTSWEAVGSFKGGDYVDSLASFNGSLYAAGEFDVGGVTMGVVRWDGSSWVAEPTPAGAATALRTLTLGGVTKLYTRISGAGVLASDGVSWQPVGDGSASLVVEDFAVHDDGSGETLYAAVYSGASPLTPLARLEGASWVRIGDDVRHSHVIAPGGFTLAEFDDGTGSALYVGGLLDSAGGARTPGIVKWDGVALSAIPDGPLTDYIARLEVIDFGSGPELYAGGSFPGALAKVNPSAGIWSLLGGGLTGRDVEGMALVADARGSWLYVVGSIMAAGGAPVQAAARWGCADGCYADCDASGDLDFFDFLCFQNLFAAGELQADCDGSGELDFFDFLCFQNEFAAGCP